MDNNNAVATITERLCQWNSADPQAWNNLVPLVYDQLKIRARQMLSRYNNHTLQATALINELYLKFSGHDGSQWKNRHHFFAVVAISMRHILINEVVRKSAVKHGSEAIHVTSATNDLIGADNCGIDFIDLDRALKAMEDEDSLNTRIVELRYFAGLKFTEIADVLELNERTVRRRWEFAKAWLFAYLQA